MNIANSLSKMSHFTVWVSLLLVAAFQMVVLGIVSVCKAEDAGKATYTITATAGEHGSISPSSSLVIGGRNHEIIITPYKGFRIADVKLDNNSILDVKVDDKSILKDKNLEIDPETDIGTYYFYNVTSDRSISAEFIEIYTITTEVVGYGSISPSSPLVKKDGNQEITITPYKGFRIADVKVDDKSILKDENLEIDPETDIGTYTFTNVTSNHTIYAKFGIKIDKLKTSLEAYPKWKGDSCGCVLDFSEDIVYGFYPFWMAEEAKNNVTEQFMNFSTLSRIGYFAALFDTNTETLHWNLQNFGENAMQRAKKYKTKIDLVIYIEISGNERAYFDRIAWKIAAALSSGDMPDGITLYFDFEKLCEPEDFDLEMLIQVLVNELKSDAMETIVIYKLTEGDYGELARDNKLTGNTLEKLKDMNTLEKAKVMKDREYREYRDRDEFVNVLKKASGNNLQEATVDQIVQQAEKKIIKTKLNINIMLPMSAIGKDAYSWVNLYKINKYIDLFLVFLEEPTTKRKKDLRIMIERCYPGKGKERKDMLRKIVPVIPPSNFSINEQQFYDDLIYFEDNFGGVGLWPVPVKKENVYDAVNKEIIKVFYGEEDRGFFQELMAVEDSWYCKIVCPNRWYFRWAMDLFIGIFAVHFLLWFFILDLRILFNHSWCFLGYSILLAFIFLSLNLCDPWYVGLRGLFFILFMLLLIAVFICLYIRRRKQATFP